MEVQNRRNNATDVDLAKGSKCMIKVEGFQGKLEAKYMGRYTVIERTEGGNYILQSAKGTEMKRTYPLNKLKPILEENIENQESFGVEKILDKRRNG